MPTPALLDFEALLAPIPGDNPAGVSLRSAVGETLKYQGGDFDEITQLRPKKDNDAFVASGQAGQWPQIEKLASRKLRERSKDLTLACWLTEALVNLHGFAGLRDGMKLIYGLLDRFWDGVYPLPDEGDLEVRVAPLQPLFERNAAAWLKEARMSKADIPNDDGGEPIFATYNLWHLISRGSEDHIHLKGSLDKATTDTPVDFYVRLRDDINETQTELAGLKDKMAEKFNDVAPGVTTVADALRSCKGYVETILKSKGYVSASGDGATVANDQSDGSNHSNASGYSGSGALRTREDAALRLREVADFFRRTEPHSPVPYLIQRAISWSQMSFEQLLGELVKDDTSRQEINSTLGIRDDGTPTYAGSGNGESEG